MLPNHIDLLGQRLPPGDLSGRQTTAKVSARPPPPHRCPRRPCWHVGADAKHVDRVLRDGADNAGAGAAPPRRCARGAGGAGPAGGGGGGAATGSPRTARDGGEAAGKAAAGGGGGGEGGGGLARGAGVGGGGGGGGGGGVEGGADEAGGGDRGGGGGGPDARQVERGVRLPQRLAPPRQVKGTAVHRHDTHAHRRRPAQEPIPRLVRTRRRGGARRRPRRARSQERIRRQR